MVVSFSAGCLRVAVGEYVIVEGGIKKRPTWCVGRLILSSDLLLTNH